VPVLVGALTSLTWIFGYAFSKALMRVCRTPTCAIGLAHQVIVPDVADPEGDFDDDLVVDELPHAARMIDELATTTANILTLFDFLTLFFDSISLSSFLGSIHASMSHGF
jgi:hypothetical protein